MNKDAIPFHNGRTPLLFDENIPEIEGYPFSIDRRTTNKIRFNPFTIFYKKDLESGKPFTISVSIPHQEVKVLKETHGGEREQKRADALDRLKLIYTAFIATWYLRTTFIGVIKDDLNNYTSCVEKYENEALIELLGKMYKDEIKDSMIRLRSTFIIISVPTFLKKALMGHLDYLDSILEPMGEKAVEWELLTTPRITAICPLCYHKSVVRHLKAVICEECDEEITPQPIAIA